tara:strand:+ start:7526 stop:7723 length:198 start_codon:yes stop_codon:yes gene_type:complete
MSKQVEQALQILEQVVDGATASGIFKKASEAALVNQAFEIIKSTLLPPEEVPKPVQEKAVRKIKK